MSVHSAICSLDLCTESRSKQLCFMSLMSVTAAEDEAAENAQQLPRRSKRQRSETASLQGDWSALCNQSFP